MSLHELPSRRDSFSQNEIGTEFDFGGVKERIVTRDDFSLEKARQVLRQETTVVLGYGIQAPAQSLNLKDNGIKNVIVGQRKGSTFDKAVSDGWISGGNLFSPEEAIKQARELGKPLQIQYLLSDAGQKDFWPTLAPLLKPGDALYFSHGFSYVFRRQTGVVPPSYVDVILVAPKGAGRSVREHFKEGKGINSSFAVAQDYTGRAMERTLATGMAIGSGFLFPTTFENEVYSDLTGERGVLLGAPWGLCQAGYLNLRELGYSPEEAAKHTIEVLTQTISKTIGEKGADGLIKDLRLRNALSPFADAFLSTYEASKGVFEDLYQKVVSGVETQRVLEANSLLNYREVLDGELKQMAESELGQASATLRELRQKSPIVPSRIENNFDAIMAGALVGIMHRQYDLFRMKGHLPSEAFNETVEEATQSLYPLVDERGMDWMFANCSTTAQRGALDWNKIFKDTLLAPLGRVYRNEDHRSVDLNNIISNSEMWKAGVTVRQLRPENQKIS